MLRRLPATLKSFRLLVRESLKRQHHTQVAGSMKEIDDNFGRILRIHDGLPQEKTWYSAQLAFVSSCYFFFPNRWSHNCSIDALPNMFS